MRRAIDFSKHKRKGSSIFLSTPSARRATGRIDYETHRRNIFLSTPSARRATQQPERMGDRHQISIHALREEGDQKGHTERRRQAISIHALREEGDIPESYTELDGSVFLSTPSARRATYASRRHRQHRANFYPRPPRGGRPLATQLASCCCEFLSTPSARRATIPADKDGVRIAISIHALREEGDQGLPLNRTRFEIFLSTPSARRATATATSLGYSVEISIHALREEGDGQQRQGCHDPYAISIHALREEGDHLHRTGWQPEVYFYPRPPRGGRRAVHRSDHGQQPISIHALREEGDTIAPALFCARTISIHALREEGDASEVLLSLRQLGISIHALREEGDSVGRSRSVPGRNFYPRPPRGGRPMASSLAFSSSVFLSTPSARRATRTRASYFAGS